MSLLTVAEAKMLIVLLTGGLEVCLLTLLWMELSDCSVCKVCFSSESAGCCLGAACTELSSKNIFALRYNRLYAALPTFTQSQDGEGIAEFLKTK